MPSPLLDISWMTSRIGVSAHDRGTASPACISALDAHQPLAELAARDAGSRSPPARKPFSTSSVIASASPSASAAVVLAVGTRFSGQASSATLQSSATSAACASVDVGSPVIAISFAPMPADRLEQAQELLGLAAVRQRDDDVVAG